MSLGVESKERCKEVVNWLRANDGNSQRAGVSWVFRCHPVTLESKGVLLVWNVDESIWIGIGFDGESDINHCCKLSI